MNERNHQSVPQEKRQRGTVIVFFVVGLTALLGIGALAIDVGYAFATRSELQNVADAGALAGARYLGEEYSKLAPSAMESYTFTQAEVFNAVNAVASQNRAANMGITIRIEDVQIGRWDATKEKEPDERFEANPRGPDAVTVRARRDGSANGAITTFFARILGIDTFNVTSSMAIAALSGPAQVNEGELNTPFGLSERVFPNNCTDVISFSPTSSCAGWHNFFDPINANRMEEKLLGFIQGQEGLNCEYCGETLSDGPEWLTTNFDIAKNKTPNAEETPVTTIGSETQFEFQGGTIASLFNGAYLDTDYDGNSGTVIGNAKNPAPIIALFDFFRYRDGDGDDSIWTATIPVYDDFPDRCRNPNTSIEIVGFARIEVLNVNSAPSNNIGVRVDCQLSVIDGRGGGTTFGNLRGTIPNLVK